MGIYVLNFARIIKHKTIKDTIQLVVMLAKKLESSSEYLFRLASLSTVNLVSLIVDFKIPFFDTLGGILLIRLKYQGEICLMTKHSVSTLEIAIHK